MENVKYVEFFKRTDLRGTLIPIEAYKHVPFQIERIFFIKDLDKHPRGFHAHKVTEQVLLPIIGSFEIELTDGKRTQSFELNQDNIGIYVPTNIWLKMYNYTSNCIICVICSCEYNEEEYIRNYGDYIEYVSTLDNTNIPCVDLSQQTKILYPKLVNAVNRVLRANSFVLGPELESFERHFAEYTNMKYCVGTSNGTSAMICALKALQLPPGSEIIVQSNAYIAAPLAIEVCGHKVKVIDIDDTLNMDLDELEKNLTPEIKTVLIVHLYGSCADMKKLNSLKQKYGFNLIEDCAQAHGSTFDGKHLGTFGEIGCYSFYPSKNLGSAGEGGCIITNIERYADFIRKYRNYGSTERYVWEVKGCNERMHNIQAAILDVKLPYLDLWNQQRRILAQEYDKLLRDIPQVIIPKNHPKLYRNYHLYCVLVQDRDKLLQYLDTKRISCAIHYPETFYKSPAFAEYNELSFVADQIKKQIVSLPMFPELQLDQVQLVCQSIREYYLD